METIREGLISLEDMTWSNGTYITAWKRSVTQEIAKYWQNNGNFQADLGTKMHRSIELYLNEAERDVSGDSTVEMKQFFDFFEKEIRARSWVA